MSAVLAINGVVVAEYDSGEAMLRELSPRPYLHHVRTLGGLEMTETHPSDHAHHYGLSMALPDVDGTSYWGGRTFVEGVGSTLLANHGRQVSTGLEATPQLIVETLDYLDQNGRLQLTESRRISARPVASGWVLGWRSALTADAALSFGSPQTNGRDGAFYGGIFWRLPFTEAGAFTATASDVAGAHGSDSAWLAITNATGSLVASNPERLPWFVRTEGYVGFGPAVAVDTRRELAAGETLLLGLDVLVSDLPSVTPDVAAELAAELER